MRRVAALVAVVCAFLRVATCQERRLKDLQVDSLHALPYNYFADLPQLPPDVAAAIPANQSQLIGWDLGTMLENKRLIAAGLPWALDAVEGLISYVESSVMPLPVFDVRNKTLVPKTGNPRDYLSLADHWFPRLPSPGNPDGLPYHLENGINPETYALAPNGEHLRLTLQNVGWLGLAYFFTDNVAYAQRARDKVVRWFLAPDSSMTPNMQYAQMVRGQSTDGRPQGIIDMAPITFMFNGLALLQGSPVWGAAEQNALAQWVAQYVAWLETSPHAYTERQTINFHGTWFDAQLMALYRFLGRWDDAGRIAYYGRERLNEQVKDGEQVYEITTVRSLQYVQTNLDAWLTIAEMAAPLGIDVYTYGLGEGHSLKDAFDYLSPYLETHGTSWPYRQYGSKSVRASATLVTRMYKGYAARNPNGTLIGPREYLYLNQKMQGVFDTNPQQRTYTALNLCYVLMSSDYVQHSVPMMRTCRHFWCHTTTVMLLGGGIVCALLMASCLLYNRWIHSRAARARGLPTNLRRVAEAQRRLAEAGLVVEPAKPSFVAAIRAEEEQQQLVAAEEERREAVMRDVKVQIKQVEKAIALKKKLVSEDRKHATMMADLQEEEELKLMAAEVKCQAETGFSSRMSLRNSQESSHFLIPSAMASPSTVVQHGSPSACKEQLIYANKLAATGSSFIAPRLAKNSQISQPSVRAAPGSASVVTQAPAKGRRGWSAMNVFSFPSRTSRSTPGGVAAGKSAPLGAKLPTAAARSPPKLTGRSRKSPPAQHLAATPSPSQPTGAQPAAAEHVTIAVPSSPSRVLRSPISRSAVGGVPVWRPAGAARSSPGAAAPALERPRSVMKDPLPARKSAGGEASATASMCLSHDAASRMSLAPSRVTTTFSAVLDRYRGLLDECDQRACPHDDQHSDCSEEVELSPRLQARLLRPLSSSDSGALASSAAGTASAAHADRRSSASGRAHAAAILAQPASKTSSHTRAHSASDFSLPSSVHGNDDPPTPTFSSSSYDPFRDSPCHPLTPFDGLVQAEAAPETPRFSCGSYSPERESPFARARRSSRDSEPESPGAHEAGAHCAASPPGAGGQAGGDQNGLASHVLLGSGHGSPTSSASSKGRIETRQIDC